jgi:hypothetical protein
MIRFVDEVPEAPKPKVAAPAAQADVPAAEKLDVKRKAAKPTRTKAAAAKA